jgi:hypothetical protein
MASRSSQASLAAGYQLMASYLVWDLHDLLQEGSLRKRDARERLRQFVQMLQAAKRATEPVYPSRSEYPRTGNARAERGKRLATQSRDEELFEMIVAARGDGDVQGAGSWAQRALSVLEGVEAHAWERPEDRDKLRFIKNEVEPFLRRLGRIDQLDRYRPPSRPGLERR